MSSVSLHLSGMSEALIWAFTSATQTMADTINTHFLIVIFTMKSFITF